MGNIIKRLASTAVLAAGLLISGGLASNVQATNPADISIPVETVVRGNTGSVQPITSVNVANDMRGLVCDVTSRAVNQRSVHPNSDLIIRSNGTQVEIKDVEREANGVTPATGSLTLGNDISVSVRLGRDRIFSGGMHVEFDCSEPRNPVCELGGPGVIGLNDNFLLANSAGRHQKGPFAVNVGPGVYRVTVSSYDDHSNKPTQAQNQEKWHLIGLKNGAVVWTSNSTTDLPDNQNLLTEVIHNRVTLPMMDQVIARHSLAGQTSNPESITPTCVKFERVQEPFARCDGLDVQQLSRTRYRFSVDATAGGGAVINGYRIDLGDGTIRTLPASQTSFVHNYATEGDYTINATVLVRNAANQHCSAEVNVEVEPLLMCDEARITRLSRDTFRVEAFLTVDGDVTPTGYTFDFGDGTVIDDLQESHYTHTYDTPGTYLIQVTVHADGHQDVTCEGEVTVDEKPFISCEGVEIVFIDEMTVKLTVNAHAGNGAEITGYKFVLGDGTVLTTDANTNMVTHKYDEAGEYKISVTVLTEDGELFAVCETTVTIDPEVPVTPPGKELPKTGAASAATALFGTSAAGASLHTWINSRRNLKESLKARK